ncbi:hypothetical protein [Jannaschia pohangensis]|uniref:Uncharacterized protein n=1 Tax=Jannaschia pohangensis TaxID=390807 RepID=A0A1I3MK33_9RHOB|nr:hypothetical protein [Jannaschia pohangensis]SFI97075.1 hypothetical protein SAMN04488095_1869 [Jannaschia pohangensis]
MNRLVAILTAAVLLPSAVHADAADQLAVCVGDTLATLNQDEPVETISVRHEEDRPDGIGTFISGRVGQHEIWVVLFDSEQTPPVVWETDTGETGIPFRTPVPAKVLAAFAGCGAGFAGTWR